MKPFFLKNKRFLNTASVLFLSVFSLKASCTGTNPQNVKSDPPNNCVYFSVMISNKTNTTCELIDKQVLYGQISSSTQAPVLIPPNTSSPAFEMRQVVYGPDIILTYQCGENRKITFESQQDFCALNAGKISGKILFSSNISGKHTSDRGSYLWSRHGSIHWILH